MTEKINKREAYFIEALYKVHEKLTLIVLSIKEQRELIDSEEMDAVLEPLHELWFYGKLSFSVPTLDLKEQSVTESTLFSNSSAIPSGNEDGTEVEQSKEKKKKK